MKKIFFIIILSLIFFTPLVNAQAGLNNAFNGDNSPLKTAADSANLKTTNNLPSIFSNIILTALTVIGSIFLILLIYGGMQWTMAGGNEQKVEKASDMIKQAIIGLIIVLAAYAISYYLIKTVGEKLIS